MVYYFCIIYGNFFLYKYLDKQTENNKAVKEADKKKDRQRNIIPARASFHCAVLLVTSFMVYAVCYGIPVRHTSHVTRDTANTQVTVMLQTDNFDSSTRAYVLSVYSDLYPCILGPSSVVFGAPSIRRKLKSVRPGWIKI